MAEFVDDHGKKIKEFDGEQRMKMMNIDDRSDADRASERTAAPELEDPRTAGGNVRCTGGPDLVRERDGAGEEQE